MASLRKKHGSPYWFACFTLPDGRQTQRSTKQTDRRKAQALAEQFEKASRLAAQGRLGEAQARSVLADLYEITAGERLLSATTRDYLTRWAESRKADTSASTHAAYSQVARDFITSLGTRADLDISQVSKADVGRFRNAVLTRTSPASANKALKYLRVALGAAHKDGYTQDNPAALLDTLKRTAADRQQRRAFTLDELRMIFNAANGEWKGLIVFGLYTAGQRLGDIARLTWQNVDTMREELRFVTAKTGRQMNIPFSPPLKTCIENMDAGDNPAAPLFPQAFADITKAGTAAPLSKQFHALLVSVGLAKPWETTGVGKHGKRNLNEVSFHSLRHTATSLLKNAGAAEIVARDLVGHQSEAVSRNYSHVDETAKRKAMAGMEDVFGLIPPDAKQSTPRGAKKAGRG
jgi:integrase